MNRPKKLLLLLCALCFFIRLGFALSVPADDPYYPDGTDYSRVATAIAEGRGFYPPGTEPVILYRPPLHPFVLGSLYRLTGIENYTPIRAAQCMLAVVTGLLLFSIATMWQGEIAGLIALGVYSVHPFFIYHAATISPETLLLFLTCACYYFLFKLFSTRRPLYAALTGLILGLAMLTKGTVLFVLPAAVLTLAYLFRKNWTRAVAPILAVGGFFFLTQWPLIQWIHSRWNETSFMLDGSGLNFWIANSDYSDRLFKAKTSQEFRQTQMDLWMNVIPSYDDQIKDLSPNQRNAFYLKMGWADFKKHPGGSFRMALERLKVYWKPWVHPLAYGRKEVILSALFTMPLFLFGFWEILRRLRRWEPDALFMAFLLIPVTVVNGMIFNTEIRYRLPLVDSLLIVYSACLLAELFRGAEKRGPLLGAPKTARKPVQTEVSRI